MDQELKEKWVKALRSGRYKQARGQMFNGYGYCCLGVLCKVARVEMGDYTKVYMLLGSDGGDGIAQGLWSVNDDPEEIPFDVIAGLIEEAL